MPEKRTYAQRAETIKKAVTKKRKLIRRQAIQHLGNKCQLCGYDQCTDALEIHHRNPNLKRFGISEDGITRSWKKVRVEINNCVLLCANCHREFHAGMTQLPAATPVENDVNSGKS